MSNVKTLTAPLAVIRVGGKAVGLMKDIRVTETIRRGRVAGIGNLTPKELPPLEWSGSLSCGFYTINFDKSRIPGAITRTVESIDDFVDTVLLQEDGVQIDVLRKVKRDYNPVTEIYSSDLEVFASIKGAFVTREGFNISEGQISGQDVDFDYTNPILYSL